MSKQFARRIEVEDVGDVAVVTFVDRVIAGEEVHPVFETLRRLVEELGRRKVLLNFGGIEYLSSAALGKLITLHRKLQAVQGKLVLCKIARDILDVFRITKLDRFFTLITDPTLAGTDDLIGAAFGNPFPTTAVSPAWRTDTALTLARQISNSRDFSAMPILADALQDAGCNDETLLAHLRAPSLTPVRGRWLVERVLGEG
jgi:anti-sigma B factor antagonist